MDENNEKLPAFATVLAVFPSSYIGGTVSSVAAFAAVGEIDRWYF